MSQGRMYGRTDHSRKSGLRQCSEIGRGAFGPRSIVRPAANGPILGRPARPVIVLVLGLRIRTCSTVHLMKRCFAQQYDKLRIRLLENPTESIEVDEPAAGTIETLVNASNQFP